MMRAGKATLANSGARMCREGFNTAEFVPDHPDEMGLWPKGVVASLRVVEGLRNFTAWHRERIGFEPIARIGHDGF